jgi:uncharacterized protein
MAWRKEMKRLILIILVLLLATVPVHADENRERGSGEILSPQEQLDTALNNPAKLPLGFEEVPNEEWEKILAESIKKSGFKLSPELEKVKPSELDAETQFAIGMATFDGNNFENMGAVMWFRYAAEKGYAYAQHNLGVMHESRVAALYASRAVKWFRPPAKKGDPPLETTTDVFGMTNYDDKVAAKWYRLAAEQGITASQMSLGWLYFYGLGVPKDNKEMMRWFRPAAENGQAEAQLYMGMWHADGDLVKKDDKEAVKWYRKSAEQGVATAQTNLGEMYKSGRGVLQDDKKAVKWFRKSAAQDDATGQLNLGVMYYNGRGVPQNYNESEKLWLEVAKKGRSYDDFSVNGFGGFANVYAKAEYFLGIINNEGRGKKQDFHEALKWFRLAAKREFPKAQFQLGDMYEKGKGVIQDYVQAHKWLNLAGANGYEDGRKARSLLEKRMTPAQIAEAQKLARESIKVAGKK